MINKTREVLMPRYLQSFNCIGAACEDTCCCGWSDILIDKKTYEKFTRVQDPRLKKIINRKVKLKRPEQTIETYAQMELNHDSSCPFLTEEKLCSLQLKHGEEYLPLICFAFPRAANIVNGILEKSAVMSCPEAARLALLNPAGIDFILAQEPVQVRNIVSVSVNTKDPAYNNTSIQYFLELRDLTINILKNRNYELEERLIILGLFFQRLSKTSQAKAACNIPALIDSFSQLLRTESLKPILGEIPGSTAVQLEVLLHMAFKRNLQGVSNKGYVECFNEFLQGVKHTPGVTLEFLTENYRLAFKNYYSPFADEHQYIFENFLVNYVFKNLYPLCKGDIFDEYVKLVFLYSLIKMYLIGIAGFHQGLVSELVVKLIQSLAKTIEHNLQYQNDMVDWFKKNGMNSMSYLSILIKN